MAFFERVNGENFSIFQGNDVENTENARRGKDSQLSSRAPLQDRTMMVAQNNTKMLPQRTGKQQSFGVENYAPKIFNQQNALVTRGTKHELQSQPFAIFKDCTHQENVFINKVTDAVPKESEEMELHPAFTSVFKADFSQATESSSCVQEFDESMKADSVMSMCTPDEEMLQDDDIPVSVEKCQVKKYRNESHLWFPEYEREVYEYLREAEVRHKARPDYMRKQTEITHNMRSILVDWMVEVAEEYKLERETLCLSVSFVDRFLSVMAVARNKLQLVGTAAMFIAAKYEEIYPPDLGEFVYITDNSYTKKQVLQMERLILRTLSFNVAAPTVNCFSSNLLTKLESDDKTSSLAMYLLELSMLDGEKFLVYTPSVVGTSCVCLAYHITGQNGFPSLPGKESVPGILFVGTKAMTRVSELTGYVSDDLSSCASALFDVFRISATLQHPAIREKYSKEKWHRVSEIEPTSQDSDGGVPMIFS